MEKTFFEPIKVDPIGFEPIKMPPCKSGPVPIEGMGPFRK